MNYARRIIFFSCCLPCFFCSRAFRQGNYSWDASMSPPSEGPQGKSARGCRPDLATSGSFASDLSSHPSKVRISSCLARREPRLSGTYWNGFPATSSGGTRVVAISQGAPA
jgi:hypothetical protein